MTEMKAPTTPNWKITLAWIIVLVPFVWGIVNTVQSSLVLLHHR